MKCKVDGCSKDAYIKSRQLCRPHYRSWRKTGGFDAVRVRDWKSPQECSVDGCKSVAHCRSYCKSHYTLWQRHGTPEYRRNPATQRAYGEGKKWHTAKNGYVVRFDPENQNASSNGQVYEHRHVMSEMLGRPLRQGENVHHKNGNRSDNRPENLELWVQGQPSGQRVQDVAQWAIEWLVTGNLETALALEPDLQDAAAKLRQKLKGLGYG